MLLVCSYISLLGPIRRRQISYKVDDFPADDWEFTVFNPGNKKKVIKIKSFVFCKQNIAKRSIKPTT